MTKRYEVYVAQYEAGQGWDAELIGLTRAFYVKDEATKAVIAKFPCRDQVEHRGTVHRNDQVYQQVRAHKLCEYMNKVEAETLANMTGASI